MKLRLDLRNILSSVRQSWPRRGLGLSVFMLAGMAAVTAAAILYRPMATNDGPVHVAFANLIATLGRPEHELQRHAYALTLRLNPNLLIYLLMAALLRVAPPGLTESLVQVLCVVGPVSAAYLALRQINPANTWLAVFVLPLSLNQMFFLGLYNHCCATGAFFLAIAAYLWMNRAPSFRRALVLASALILTFLCHASGFIMAMAGVGTMTAMNLVATTWRKGVFKTYSAQRHAFAVGVGTMTAMNLVATTRQERVFEVFSARRHAFAAMVAPLPLAAIFLSGIKGGIDFGPSVATRVYLFGVLNVLRVNSRLDSYLAVATSLVLAFASLWATVEILGRKARRDEAAPIIAAGVVAFLVMLAFPETLGGGWTHFRRFVIYPFFWALLLLAFQSFSTRARGALIGFGVAVSLGLVGSAMYRQSIFRSQMAPLAEVDRQVGSHCTVLPLVLNDTVSAGFPTYNPLFQAANRLELRNDRVVLFNFLARLNVYPIRFIDSVEPQSHLFHWAPQRHEVSIETVDITGFERTSGLHVDYLLVSGAVEGQPQRLRGEIENAVAEAVPIYSAAVSEMSLYRRPGGDLCREER